MRSTRVVLMLTLVPGLWATVLGAQRSSPADAPQPAALDRQRTIELPGVEGRIDHLSLDAQGRRLFVAALGNDTVEVVDLASGRRVRTIRGLAEPQGVLVLPEENRLFVASRRDGTLRVFDATGYAPVATLRLGSDADNLRRGSDGRVWVGYGDGALAAVDTDGRKLAEVALGAHPESFQLEQKGHRIFVNVPDRHEITVVDGEQAKVVARWSTDDAAANYPMALDEAEKRLLVVCRSPARLLVLDTDSGAIVARRPAVGDADDVFYDATARRVYVSGGEGTIGVYREDGPDRFEEVGRVATSKGARTSLFSPELGRLFLAVRRQGTTPAAIWEYATRGHDAPSPRDGVPH
jgi:DNA-binding beta-propeller fold protein YncE